MGVSYFLAAFIMCLLCVRHWQTVGIPNELNKMLSQSLKSSRSGEGDRYVNKWLQCNLRSAIREEECTVSRDVSRDEGNGNPAWGDSRCDWEGKLEKATMKR